MFCHSIYFSLSVSFVLFRNAVDVRFVCPLNTLFSFSRCNASKVDYIIGLRVFRKRVQDTLPWIFIRRECVVFRGTYVYFFLSKVATNVLLFIQRCRDTTVFVQLVQKNKG